MGAKFSPVGDRLKTYLEVRRVVEREGFHGPSALRRSLEASGYPCPSRETLTRWALGKTSPFTGKRLFDPKPSPELSFFIGAWLGDGWADDSDGGKRLRLKVRSRSFAEEFAGTGTTILGKSEPYGVWITEKDGRWFNVKVTSFSLYDFLQQKLEMLRPMIEAFPDGFLRGIFTAEGCPSVSISQRGGQKLNVGLELGNSDKHLMQVVRAMLLEKGYHPGKLRINHRRGKRTTRGLATTTAFLLGLHRFDEVKRFSSEVGFADGTKQNKLDEAITLKEEHGPARAAAVWKTLYVKRSGDWTRL